jgi:hypothetical protein
MKEVEMQFFLGLGSAGPGPSRNNALTLFVEN